MQNVPRQLGRLILSLALGCAAIAHGADPSPNPVDAMLYLNDGDYFSGRLRDCQEANVLRWQANGATQSFEFGADAIRSAYFAPPEKRPAPTGEYCFELSDGDVLYGTLTAITKDDFEIDSGPFGHPKIARAEVRRLLAADSETFVYRGPNGLAEWTSDDIFKWRQEAGRLVTDKRGASIKKSIAIPDQAHFEFEIAWTKTPQFTLAFCASDKSKQLAEGFKIEVWGKKLVLVREVNKSADVALITELDSHTDRVHLEALYNHATGEFSVQSLDGRELAKITLPKQGGYPLRVIQLTNGGQEVSLEQLAVIRWNGHVSSQVDVDKQRLHLKDGSIVYGDVTGYDASAKQFVVNSDGKERRINSLQVASVVQSPVEQATKAEFRISLHDGSRFSGGLVKVENDKLYLKRPGIDQLLACALPNVRSLVGLKHEAKSAPYSKDRTGRWESKGIMSIGSVAAAPTNSDPGASCLVWKPRSSNTSSPLRSDVSGRFVYRDPIPPQKEGNAEENGRRPRAGVFWGAVTRALGAPTAARQSQMSQGAATLCLLAGDRIPCESVQIDEDGIHFTSSVVAADFVPHRSIKALEFVPKWTAAALAEVKRTRLLTLPRMQKGSPPTHLVASTAGDFLRCRLISVNTDSLTVEARLENKKLSRDRVACIIWLHDLDSAKPAPAPATPPTTGLQVQAVLSDGNRLTFAPKECDGATLAGVSDVLGACRVRLNAVDQLLLGSVIRETAEAQTYGMWKLHDAAEPEFAREGADAGKTPNPGADSILIGKAAPDFQLDLLDGKHFKLSEHKGKVIVLDFWASWCGFCMQSMPDVHKLMGEFKGRDVEYVTVNAQEDQATVKSALERLKIEPTTVLDIDGAAGEKFQATSLPQIVVIDTEMKVSDLIIGANPDLVDQLRAAIQKALDPKKPK
jgi:thiol-disulfide isomerase/thioredoxin